METSQDSGSQAVGHALKFLKNKKIHIFQKLMILLCKTCDNFI